MRIHLVRHADAGSRKKFAGPDDRRPLDPRGAAQAAALAEGLAEALSSSLATCLVASPFVRCRQTLEPLGTRLSLPVTTELALAEGTSGATALDRLLSLGADGGAVVACSHGDVIPAVLGEAARRGAVIDRSNGLPKASRYDLEVVDGEVLSGTFHPRPHPLD
ncbi:MAG TPA: histidine phosphatase family protein [Acidimicrobiales bacterium]|jgi:8-oxo-dGTP diphosphatase